MSCGLKYRTSSVPCKCLWHNSKEPDLGKIKDHINLSKLASLDQVHFSAASECKVSKYFHLKADGTVGTKPDAVLHWTCAPVLSHDNTLAANLHRNRKAILTFKQMTCLAKSPECTMSLSTQSCFIGGAHVKHLRSLNQTDRESVKARLSLNLGAYAKFLLSKKGIEIVKGCELDTYLELQSRRTKGAKDERRILPAMTLTTTLG